MSPLAVLMVTAYSLSVSISISGADLAIGPMLSSGSPLDAETPLRRQYLALKKQHPDTILFFRLGDFYETFDEDAKLVASELQITLTSRPMAKGQRVPMAGVPHHSVDNYIARLIARGHKVAMAEQLG